MRMKRVFMALALYGAWMLAGIFGAAFLTYLFALVHDPHANGPVGEGLLYLGVFVVLLPLGLALGGIRASAIWNRRNSKP